MPKKKENKITIVLDTNIFINPDAHNQFGTSPEKALFKFLTLVKNLPEIECYMPPSVYEELNHFISLKKIAPLNLIIKQKPPSKYDLMIPSLFFYEFIDQMRNRINKGLRIAEKYIRKTADNQDEKSLIKSVREEYRTALREGILDSAEDCDLLFLAKELNSILATTDKGLKLWAEKLGISCIDAEQLQNLIELLNSKRSKT